MVWIPKEPKYKPKPPTPHNTPTNTPTDLVSRESVLAEFQDGRDVYDIMESIESLPSADVTEMMEDGTLVVRVSGAKDVSRVLVMDTDSHVGGGLYYVDKDDEPTGEWVKATGMMPPEFHGHHCCSVCGGFAGMEVPYGNREDFSKYCPNCGKRMMYKGGDTE